MELGNGYDRDVISFPGLCSQLLLNQRLFSTSMDFFLFRVSSVHVSVTGNAIDTSCDRALYMTKYSELYCLVKIFNIIVLICGMFSPLFSMDWCDILTITFIFSVIEAKTFWANVLI